MKNTDPVMGAKLKSKADLQNRFFDFLSRFFAHLASKVAKSANMTPKNFLGKNKIRYQKTQNFTLISNPLKKL
jgi:hypothetical protein